MFKNRSTVARLLRLGLLLLISAQLCASPSVPRIYSVDGTHRIDTGNSIEERDSILSKLDSSQIAYTVEENLKRKSLGFIVVTDRYADKESAADTLEVLVAAGITDYLYVQRGVYTNRISVGVFTSELSAIVRADSLSPHGLDFQVVERFENVVAYEIAINATAISQRQLEAVLSDDSQDLLRKTVTDETAVSANVPVEPLTETKVEVAVEATSPSEAVSVPLAANEVGDDVAKNSPVVAPPSVILKDTSLSQAEPVTSQSPSWFWFFIVVINLIFIGAAAYVYTRRRSELRGATDAKLETRGLQTEIASLKAELEQARAAQETQSEQVQLDNDALERQLATLGDELASSQEKLKQVTAERNHERQERAQVDELEAQLQETRKAVADEAAKTRDAIQLTNVAKADVERLTGQLDAVEAKLSASEQAEAAARRQIDELVSELSDVRTQAEKRKASETQQQDSQVRIKNLESALADSEAIENEHRIQLEQSRKETQQLKQQGDSQVAALEASLKKAEQALANEISAKAEFEEESGRQLADLQTRIASFESDNNDRNTQVEESLETLQRQEKDSQAQIATLQSSLQNAEQDLADEVSSKAQLEEESSRKIAELQARITHFESDDNERKTQIEDSLETLQRREKDSQAQIATLQSSLQNAEQDLADEVSSKAQLEEESSRKIAELQARITRFESDDNERKTQMETSLETMQRQEKDSQAQIATLQSSLQNAEQDLADEVSSKAELEQASSKEITDLQSRVSHLELKESELQTKADKATAYAKRQKELLDRSQTATKNSAKAAAAAKKIAKQLKARLEVLEKESKSPDSKPVVETEKVEIPQEAITKSGDEGEIDFSLENFGDEIDQADPVIDELRNEIPESEPEAVAPVAINFDGEDGQESKVVSRRRRRRKAPTEPLSPEPDIESPLQGPDATTELPALELESGAPIQLADQDQQPSEPEISGLDVEAPLDITFEKNESAPLTASPASTGNPASFSIDEVDHEAESEVVAEPEPAAPAANYSGKASFSIDESEPEPEPEPEVEAKPEPLKPAYSGKATFSIDKGKRT